MFTKESKPFENRLFSNPQLETKKIIMLGGKGGVGKTTCASAMALRFADTQKKTLILSSDYTPSLSDIFETEIGSEITRIPEVENLYAVELSYDQVVRMWKEKFGPEVYEVVSSFLPVGREVLDYFAEAPGIDEQFMLAYVLDLYNAGKYDKLIWDTAPAGHTLSLLRLESRFYDHLTQAAKFYTKIHSYFDKLKEIIKPESKRSPIELIETWRELANTVMSTLRNPEITEFIPVTIPEALGVYQTERIINELLGYGIDVTNIIVNNLLPESICTSEFLLSRFEVQAKYLRLLSDMCDKRVKMTWVPLLPYEVKGVESLRKIYEFL